MLWTFNYDMIYSYPSSYICPHTTLLTYRRGHKCYIMSEKSVSSCRTKCARTFDKVRNQNRCAENCFGNTCELINKNLFLAGTTEDPTMYPSFRPTPRPTPSPTRTPRPTKTPKPTVSLNSI